MICNSEGPFRTPDKIWSIISLSFYFAIDWDALESTNSEMYSSELISDIKFE